MSGRTSSSDMNDLLQIQARCRELRKEKDTLRESQAESFELIRRLELHVKTLSKAQIEDKKHIHALERELSNCCQEIDYLQDQLNSRNSEVDCLSEHVHTLELKLTDMEDLEKKLREELRCSHSERLILMQELENTELELQNSTLCIEKLQLSISSIMLEHQCEIESLKLDLMAVEDICLEDKKFREESPLNKARMDELMQDYVLQIQEAHGIIDFVDKENRELREKIETYERNAKVFRQSMEEKFQELLQKPDTLSPSSTFVGDTSICGHILGPLLSKLAMVGVSHAELRGKMVTMSQLVDEYELLVKRLKEELREEKLKAKEEADDLAQEMAELRYQINGLLEEECKRRSCAEQLSLKRIAELEAQVNKEHKTSVTALRHIQKV